VLEFVKHFLASESSQPSYTVVKHAVQEHFGSKDWKDHKKAVKEMLAENEKHPHQGALFAGRSGQDVRRRAGETSPGADDYILVEPVTRLLWRACERLRGCGLVVGGVCSCLLRAIPLGWVARFLCQFCAVAMLKRLPS
jgi:hypothetical protein